MLTCIWSSKAFLCFAIHLVKLFRFGGNGFVLKVQLACTSEIQKVKMLNHRMLQKQHFKLLPRRVPGLLLPYFKNNVFGVCIYLKTKCIPPFWGIYLKPTSISVYSQTQDGGAFWILGCLKLIIKERSSCILTHVVVTVFGIVWDFCFLAVTSCHVI